MKKIFFPILLLCLGTSLPVMAKSLFTYDPSPDRQRGIATGSRPILLASDLFNLPAGTELTLKLHEGEEYTVVHDNKMSHGNGDMSWFGYLKGRHKGFRVMITKGRGVIRGRIRTPDDLYIIKTSGSGLVIESREERGLVPVGPGEDDFRVEELSQAAPQSLLSTATVPAVSAASDSGSKVTIDLMVLYNQDFALAYPGSELQTRINELISVANQAYIDSLVNITLRLVHTEEINYTSWTSNDELLDDLTNGVGVFANIASLRQTYGADLVTFIRPFASDYHDGCGKAWIGGYNGNDMSLYAHLAYSVISEGADGWNYCDDFTLPHELGHNMGCSHDRDNTTIQGAYPYSYGYDVAGTNAFGTIMSYDEPTLGYFSNPDVSECNGQPCGIDIYLINSANNALSMNNTRFKVADFTAAASNDTSSTDTVNITKLAISPETSPQVNTPLTVTAYADNPGGQQLYYKFYAKGNYGTAAYDTSPWTVVQPYSTSNSAQYTFSEPGNYIIVARAVTDPDNEPEALPIIGQAITVGNGSEVFITNMSHNSYSPPTVDSTVTFTTNATTDGGDTIYYKCYYAGKYGTAEYPESWVVVRGYSTTNTCDYSFPEAGDYIVVVRAVTDPRNEPDALPIIGSAIHVE